ncbi:MAG: winged helix DNA-binding protein [Clostridia bacterium]|nr:winged helix DNA-binding protein [Clostridia bacterium]
MKIESVKLLIDVCAEASHLPQLMPKLPKGITPRMVRVIEQIALKTRDGRRMQVSDISEMLDVTRPGITAVVRELHAKGYVEKTKDLKDSRVVYVSLTPAGLALYQRYVEDYHRQLAEALAEIGDEGAERLAGQIRRLMALVQASAAEK